MIIRVPDTETLSGVEKFVHRLVTELGLGSARAGGVAVFDCPIPRPRRGRSATSTADLVIWTPHGCTVVVIRGFGSVQHGPLEIRDTGRWLVGDRPADLAVSKSAPNPLIQAHKQAAELRNCFRPHGLDDEIDILVVLVPKTGSRITWNEMSPGPGSDIVLVRIGQSTALTEYFRRPRTGPVRWRAEDVIRAFEILDLDEHLPAPEELVVEGFPTSMPVWAPVPDVEGAPAVDVGAPEPAWAVAGGAGAASPVVPAPSDVASPDVPGEAEPSAMGEADAMWANTEDEARGVTRVERLDLSPAPEGGGRGPSGSTDAVSEVDGSGAVTVAGNTAPAAEEPPALVGGTELEPGTGRPGPAAASTVVDRNPGPSRPGEDRLPHPAPTAEPREAAPVPEPVASASGRRSGAVESVSAAASTLVAEAGEWFGSVRSTVVGLGRRPEPKDGTDRAEPYVADPPDTPAPASAYAPPSVAVSETDRYRESPLDRAAEWPVIGVALRRPVALLTAGALVVVALVASAFAASGIARFDIEEYERMCAEPRGFTTAAAYTSTGPSPVYLAGDLRSTGIGGSPVWGPEEPASVQLIACLSATRTGTLVRTCQYGPIGGNPVGRTLNLFRAVYRVSVYEARTGRLLTGVELDGERFSADPASTETDICRAAADAPDDDLPGRRYGRPSQRQIRQVLDPLVRPERVS